MNLKTVHRAIKALKSIEGKGEMYIYTKEVSGSWYLDGEAKDLLVISDRLECLRSTRFRMSNQYYSGVRGYFVYAKIDSIRVVNTETDDCAIYKD
jgi:hypothetical protein